MASAPSCRDCRFLSGLRQSTQCRRYPPVVDFRAPGNFPVVKPTWWCGEYKSIPEAKPKGSKKKARKA